MRQYEHIVVESPQAVDDQLAKLHATKKYCRTEGITESEMNVFTIFYSYDNDFSWNDEQTEEEEEI